jgi:hypothetical protein
MVFAPINANKKPQYGPANTCVASTTLSPSNALLLTKNIPFKNKDVDVAVGTHDQPIVVA